MTRDEAPEGAPITVHPHTTTQTPRDLTRRAEVIARMAFDIMEVLSIAEVTSFLPRRPLLARLDALVAATQGFAHDLAEST